MQADQSWHFGYRRYTLQPHVLYIADIHLAAGVFQQKLANYPNVFAVVVYADILDASENLLVIGDRYSYSNKTINDAVSRKLLLVENVDYNQSLGIVTQQRIREVFM